MKAKRKSSTLLAISIVMILTLAFAGFKGLEVAGWKFKSFNEAIVKGLDLQGGVSVLMEIQKDKVTEQELEETKDLLAQRVNKIGVSETVVNIEGEKRIRIEVPGDQNSNDIVQSLTQTGKLTFVDPEGKVVLEGADVKKATAVLDSNNMPAVSLELNESGKTKFAEATAKYIGQSITIKMDDKEISSPTVQTQITDGKASITNMQSIDKARNLAGVINSGSLKVDVKAVSVQKVGSQLGAEALPNAMKAGAIGLALIFAFMLIYYRKPGVLASIVLTFYVALTLIAFVESDVVLTLPGIAGFILTIGMAIDANVLIFERVREELARGMSIKVAVNNGFENATSSILDSNITTTIAALVLYFVGTGSVKGFAVTLIIGIVLSIFTALVVTRILMKLAVTAGVLKDDLTMGLPIIKETKFKIIEKSKIWLTISLIVMMVGAGFGLSRGLNFGIDFKGGTKVILELGKDFDKEKADKIAKKYASDAVTNSVDETQYQIRAAEMDSDKVSKMFEEYKKEFKLEDKALLSQDEIGPSVGKELTVGAIKALVIAVIGILIYIAFRFKLDFGIAALIALGHDVLITLGVFAIFNITINSPFIAAILTIIGYSINDTIVVFDRIRENSKNMLKSSPTEIANKSLNQTMSRSINTTLTTLMVIISLYIFLPTVREFTLPIFIGVAVGAYSSIFVASPLWVWLKKFEAKRSK